jgi:hypothetical protein
LFGVLDGGSYAFFGNEVIAQYFSYSLSFVRVEPGYLNLHSKMAFVTIQSVFLIIRSSLTAVRSM